MRKRLALFSFFVLLATSCDAIKREPQPQPKPEPKKDVAVEPTGDLTTQADIVVARIKKIETEKDVTCWTSFRQLDQFIATKVYSEFATLAKIEAQKNLVLAIWADASKSSKGGTITGDDLKPWLEKTTVVTERKGLAEYADKIGFQQYKEYRTTSEHFRVVMAVTTDALYQQRALKPMDESGVDVMADIATHLSLAILAKSGDVATQERSPFIEGKHVKTAYEDLKKKHGLALPEPTGKTLDAKGIEEKLFPITKALIDAKFGALKSFNADDPRSPKVVKDTLDAINTVAPLPIDEEALVHITNLTRSFAHFAASGLEPMQNDNYLNDGRFEPKDTERRLYVDAVWMENVIQQTFPHEVQANGDLKLRFEPNPGIVGAGDRKPYEVLLLDHQQNAVRDSAIHWQILEGEFGQRGFALDPFAAEMLSEVISVMFTHFLYRAAKSAKEAKRKKITLQDAKTVRDPRFVQVLPQRGESVQWSDQRKKQKETIFKTLGQTLFSDQTTASKIGKLGKVKGDVNTFGIQTVMGSGIAVGDLDRNGAPDVFLAGLGLNRLLLNKGDGTFTDRTNAWGIDSMDDSKGTLFFDANGDNKLDLLVIRARNPSLLYIQQVTKFAPPIELPTKLGAHVPILFDYDGDKDLDIYVGYYGSDAHNVGNENARNLPSMDGRNGTPNQLFRNDKGIFKTDVAKEAGVDDVGWALAGASWDYDDDGDQDLYVANDFGRNALLQNQGDGTFKDVTEATRTGDRGSGMNASLADWNNDGLADLYVSNIDMFSKSIKVIFPTDDTTITVDEKLQKAFQYIAGNKFYIAKKDGGFHFESKETEVFEPADRGWGWSANFFDYENDGDVDMYLANGWIDGSYAANQKNQMYINDYALFFLGPDASPERFAGNSRSVASADFDLDGDVDLIVNNFNQSPRYLENTQSTENRWIKVRLVGKAPNTQAIGAVVRVGDKGSGAQTFWVTGGDGYLTQSTEIHAGIGKQTAVVVTVRWPSGTETKHTVQAKEVLTAQEK